MIDTIIVLAKPPAPGRVKTRLTPPFSPADAAALAGAALLDTLDAVDASAARQRLLAFDGPAGEWGRPGWRVARQPSGDLATRMAAAFTAAGPGSAALVGMDTPQLNPSALAGFDPRHHDAAIGPTRDGGYWTIALRDTSLADAALLGVPMSMPHTCTAQVRRLEQLGLRVHMLDHMIDVDTADDARDVAALAPATRFAEAHERLLVGAAVAERR